MDDLDHSIVIAENDWSSFYDESEECDLLQPSLACLDDSDLSDSADPDQQETQRSPDANSCTKLPEQLNQSGTQGPEDDAAVGIKRGEIRASCPGKNSITREVVHKKTEQKTTEEAIDGNTNTLQTKAQKDRSSETKALTEDGVQTASDLRSAKEPDLLPSNRAGLSAEKERWFVTVIESPARRRGRSTMEKKKRKQKKACEGGLTGFLGRPESSDGGKIGKRESEQRKETQSNQSMDLREHPSDEMKVTVRSLNQELRDDAAEEVQEAQHPLEDSLTENLHFRCSSSLTCDRATENTGTDRAHSRQMSPQSAADANSECSEFSTAEHYITSPLSQKAAVIPDDNSTCANHPNPETPELLTITTRGSASACSQESAPGLPHTPCSMSDSPETYARSAGKTKPIYAISAFWNEMEKLTIDDILQVRKSSRLPSKPVQERMTPNPTNGSSLVEDADCNLSDSSLMDTSDTADSDYFTQPDESKPDCCSGQLLTSDFEEEHSHFTGASRNPSSNLHPKNQQSPSLYLPCEDVGSEGTPVPLENIFEHCLENQETQILTLWPRQKYNMQAFKTEDLSLLPLLSRYRSGLLLSRRPSLEEDTGLKTNCSLEAFNPASFLSHTDLLDAHDQTFCPEIVESFPTESESNTASRSFIVYNPEEMFAAPDFNSTLCLIEDDESSFSPRASLEQLIPIFSCSHPTTRELAFPKQHCVFLRANCEREDEISPIRLVSHSFIWANRHASSAAASGSRGWQSLLSMRKIHFAANGSFCCTGSGTWMFPDESEEIQVRRENPTVGALSEGKVGPDLPQVFREPEEQQQNIQRTKRDGMFSTVQQSDMCLVCIAFASWVLRSSDPEAADAWKAALLANVSALSAIQYLRQYMKKSPSQDGL